MGEEDDDSGGERGEEEERRWRKVLHSASAAKGRGDLRELTSTTDGILFGTGLGREDVVVREKGNPQRRPS